MSIRARQRLLSLAAISTVTMLVAPAAAAAPPYPPPPPPDWMVEDPPLKPDWAEVIKVKPFKPEEPIHLGHTGGINIRLSLPTPHRQRMGANGNSELYTTADEEGEVRFAVTFSEAGTATIEATGLVSEITSSMDLTAVEDPLPRLLTANDSAERPRPDEEGRNNLALAASTVLAALAAGTVAIWLVRLRRRHR
ncbi:hypothetical protein [Plantactinospora sp. BB1]|uniref:hypothetical protein n=1 Tax=Plantactinospora sp. BB1 TaxID=2071627 RepID=UPI000D15D02A|nr:hypothetical protein [Plantactinospora sp. BB1]AVT38466.1 hypothetical protein C6W10_20735 [Plantactinospora sp. BB1]